MREDRAYPGTPGFPQWLIGFPMGRHGGFRWGYNIGGQKVEQNPKR